MLLLPPPLSTTVKRECQPSLEIRGLGDGTQTGRAVSCVDWRFKSVKTSLTCRSGECDDCGFYHAAECALKPLCAFWKRHSWSRSVQRGPEEEEFGVLPFFSILPPSLPFHAHRLPPSFSVCVRESGGTLREWVSQSVSQSVNAADSYRRFAPPSPSSSRLSSADRKSTGWISLSFSHRTSGTCPTGTKRRESWPVEE